MNYLRKTILLFLAIALLGACSKAPVAEQMPGGTRLCLTLDGGAISVHGTRAVSESAVNDLWVLQFDASGAQLTRQYIASVTDPSSIALTTALNATANSTLYLVANTGNASLFSSQTLTQAKAVTVALTTTTGGGIPSDASTALPMVGQSAALTFPLTSAIPVNLTRAVAKVTLTVKNLLTTGYPKLTVTSTQLKNVPKSYSTQAVDATNGFTGTTYYPAASAANFINYTAVSGNITAAGTTTTYYVAPNVRGVGTATQPHLKSDATAASGQGDYCTYVEILGTAQASASAPTTDVRYRLYLGGNNTNDFNLQSNTAYKVGIELAGLYTSDARLTIATDKFDLAQGGTDGDNTGDNEGWAGYIYLNDKLGGKTANCYIITDNASKSYGFDATVRGNNATGVAGIDYTSLPDLTTATEARVIWQTGNTTSVVKSVTLQNRKVVFITGTATEGNAVVGIFASSATDAPCLWSWHIWKLNGAAPADVTCTKTPSPTTASANFKMMGLNLGAYNNTPGSGTSIGLHYQWGRKDPFPSASAFTLDEPTNIYGSYNVAGSVGNWNGPYVIQTVHTTSTIGTEAWAVKYPTAFIIQIDAPYDWRYTVNNNLWGTPWVDTGSVGGYNANQGVKTIYDPCPVGYRVPPADTWSKQTEMPGFQNYGVVCSQLAPGFWFPAGALRDRQNGALLLPVNGYYWTSSRHKDYEERACILNFTSDEPAKLDPQYYYGHASGLNVRCVAE